MKRRFDPPAFTLVEVVLALGVAAFVLIAILGLLSVALDSGKSSSDDTRLSAMADEILNDLRRREFADIPGASVSSAAVSSAIYFDGSGRRLTDQNGADLAKPEALAADAVYACTETVQGDPGTANPDGSANMARIILRFDWPAQAASPPNSKIVHAYLAKY